MMKFTIVICAVLLASTVQCDTDLSQFEGEWWQAYIYRSETRFCEHHMVKAFGTNKCTCDGHEVTFPMFISSYNGMPELALEFTGTVVTSTEEATRDLRRTCTCEHENPRYAMRKMNGNYLVLYEKDTDHGKFEIVPMLYTRTAMSEGELEAYARSIDDLKDHLPGAHSLKCKLSMNTEPL